jgi:hypothetical protein
MSGNGHDSIAAQLAALGVDVSGGPNACWLFAGRMHPSGYPRVCVNYFRTTGYRYAWALLHGAVPPGRRVYHSCAGGPRCMNPGHLSLRRPRKPPQLTAQQRKALRQYQHDVDVAAARRATRRLAHVA